MSKYGDLIKQARKTENQETNQSENRPISQQANQIAAPDHTQATPEPEPEVNLCVKVPLSLRRHWASEAKRQGTMMTAVIVEALEAKFGKPD